MTIARFALWVLVVVLLLYLLFLLHQRRIIYKNMQLQNEENQGDSHATIHGNVVVESMGTNTTDISIIQNYMKKTPTQLKGLNDNSSALKLPLSQVCIKGSYNSAYTGSSIISGGYISFAALQYVLIRGCRFVDFEVYNSGGVPTVGYFTSSQHTSPDCLFTTPEMTLNSAIQYCITNGLNKQPASSSLGVTYTVPNHTDPLFIQIRMNQGSTDKLGMMKLIGDIIKSNVAKFPRAISTYKSNKLEHIINPSTQIKDMMGKIVFVFEQEPEIHALNAAYYDGFLDGVNILYVNSLNPKLPTINTIYYSQIPSPSSSGGTASSTSGGSSNTIYIVSPDRNAPSTKNVSLSSAIQNKYQDVLMQFYIPDNGNYPMNQQYLTYYENMFDTLGAAIVPFVNVNTYVYNH